MKAQRFIDISPHDFALNIAQAGAVELVKARVRITNQQLLAYEYVHYSRLLEWANKCAGCHQPFEKPGKWPDCALPIVVEIGVDDDRLYHADCRPAYRWWHEIVDIPNEDEETTGEQLSLW